MNKTEHPLYITWKNIKSRCWNPSDTTYKYYGARGIKVCQRWLNDFWSFVEDMGDKPSPRHSIDRKDNDGDYTPENCRWATGKEQINNSRIVLKAKGFYWDKSRQKWQAQIKVNGNKQHIGSFDCPLMARLAYLDAKAQVT